MRLLTFWDLQSCIIISLISIISAPVTAQTLAITSRWEDKIVLLDTKSGEILDTIPAGDSPHEVALDSSKKIIYVPSYHGNTITKIEFEKGRVCKVFDLGENTHLHGIHLSRDGSILWVTSEEKNAVLEIDTQSGAILKKWHTDQYKSHMIVGTPDDSKLYVANIDSGSVSVIDRLNAQVKTLYTGAGAEGIDCSPNGKEVWVSNRDANSISVISTATDTIMKTLSSYGKFPVKVRFRPDGEEVWVINNQSENIGVFKARDHSLLQMIEVGKRPLGITFSPDSKTAYITSPATHEITEIDIAKEYQIKRRFPTLPSPDGLIFSY